MSDEEQVGVAGGDHEVLERLAEVYAAIKREIGKVIVGQEEFVGDRSLVTV